MEWKHSVSVVGRALIGLIVVVGVIGCGLSTAMPTTEPVVEATVGPPPEPTSTPSPTATPNPPRITFTSGIENDSEIYVMDADGSNVVQLTDNDVGDASSVFSYLLNKLGETPGKPSASHFWHKRVN